MLGPPKKPSPPSLCSIYFNPTGGKPGIKGRSVAVDHRELPPDWIEGLPAKAYRARVYTVATNKYGVSTRTPK